MRLTPGVVVLLTVAAVAFGTLLALAFRSA